MSFGYNSLNLVDSVTTPASDTPTRIAYDGVLGNSIQTISPMGVKDTVFTDAIGRDTLSYVVDDSLNKRTRTQFDVMSRPTTVTISGDGGHRPTWISGVGAELPADTVRIATEYDAEGRVKDVTRTRGPSLGYTDSYYQYDAVGRVKIAFEAVKTTHYTYDPAGNVISKNDGEHTVTMKYDALNRIVNKFVPLVTYSSTSCMTSPLMTANFTGYCFFNIPDRVTLGNAYGAAACFSSDTATYSYDVAGNLVQADNGDAKVRRGYYPNGQIQWDTLRTRQTYRGTADECGGVEPAPPPIDSLGICGDEAHGWRPCNITMSKYALPKDHELALGTVPQQQTWVPWASWSPANISARDSSIHGPYAGDEESGDGDDLGSLFDTRSLSRAFASSMAPDSEYSHIYGLSYTYNDDGEKSTLLHPTGYNVPSLCYTGPCTESYTYSTSTGELTGITDIHGLSYTIDYDNAGRAYKLTSPGSVTGPVTDTKHYDDDGNVTSIVVVSDIGLLSDSMTYDNMGRVRTGHFSGSGVATNPTEDVTMMYHGLGSVIGMETNASGSVATEAFTVDALGNRLNSWRLPMSSNAADPSTARVMDVSTNGELMTVTSPKNDSTYATYPYFYRKELGYDGVGNLSTVFTKEQNAFGTGGEVTMSYPVNYPVDALGISSFPGNVNSMNSMSSMQSLMGPSDLSIENAASFFTDSISQTAEAHFYDGDNKLRLFNRHNGIDVNSVSGSNWLYEEYRYDALGRRVWRRTQGGQAGAYVSRTVWDGDQYLYETISSANTMPGLESDSAMVGYVNADGLDAPVGVWRGTSSGTVGTMTPHVDWRGAYALGTWDDGSSNPCTGSAPKCSYIAWPAVGMSAARGHPLDVTLPSGYWMGSLLSEATDGSGLQYKRNRYYDPASGRFTQVDPIGLAGGLNAYGFGGGDQVNYSDPFGLCPPCEGSGMAYGAIAGAGIGVAITAGCAGVTAGICTAGAPIIIGASSGFGATVGGFVGKLADVFSRDSDPVGSSGGERAGKPFTPGGKEEVRGSEGSPCAYCGATTTRKPGPTQSQGEHIIPRADGGNGSPDNGVNACRTCNLDKGRRTPTQWEPRWYDPK